MRRVFLILTFIVLVVVVGEAGNVYAQDISIYIDNEEKHFEHNPVIVDGRTLVPMRFFFEALGCQVIWDEGTQTAIGVKGDKEIKLPIGETKGYINEKAKELDVESQLINNRTYIPLRFVGEALENEVYWNGAYRDIIISSPDSNRAAVPGNFSNDSLASVDGEWIYYSNWEEGALFKMKLDGSSKTKLADLPANKIHVADGWVYFNHAWCYANDVKSLAGSAGIYRIRTDGTDKERVTYRELTQEEFDEGLSRSWYALEPNYASDYFVYSTSSFSSNEALVKSTLDDGSNPEIIADYPVVNINLESDTVFFVKSDRGGHGGNIYKMNVDGTGKEKVSNTVVRRFAVTDDIIFAITPGKRDSNDRVENTVISIKADGSQEKVIQEGNYFSYINARDGLAYYWQTLEERGLYKTNIDGSELKKLDGRIASYLTIIDNWAYYYHSGLGEIYRVRTDGSKIKELVD